MRESSDRHWVQNPIPPSRPTTTPTGHPSRRRASDRRATRHFRLAPRPPPAHALSLKCPPKPRICSIFPTDSLVTVSRVVFFHRANTNARESVRIVKTPLSVARIHPSSTSGGRWGLRGLGPAPGPLPSPQGATGDSGSSLGDVPGDKPMSGPRLPDAEAGTTDEPRVRVLSPLGADCSAEPPRSTDQDQPGAPKPKHQGPRAQSPSRSLHTVESWSQTVGHQGCAEARRRISSRARGAPANGWRWPLSESTKACSWS